MKKNTIKIQKRNTANKKLIPEYINILDWTDLFNTKMYLYK